jgi:hypothetical protein
MDGTGYTKRCAPLATRWRMRASGCSSFVRLDGRTTYINRFGHPKLRMRHMPQQTGGGSIGIRARPVAGVHESGDGGSEGVDGAFRLRLNASFFQTVVDWMRNRGSDDGWPVITGQTHYKIIATTRDTRCAGT